MTDQPDSWLTYYLGDALRDDEDNKVCDVEMVQCARPGSNASKTLLGKCANVRFVFDAGEFVLVGIQRSELRRFAKFVLDTVAEMNA